MKILVTGCAGFIGYHLTKKLLSENHIVYGIDNLNPYYDVKIKKDRIKYLKKYSKFFFYKFDICDEKKLKNFFKFSKTKYVVHLAAQAGVRYSIQNPSAYFESNIKGFFNIMQCCVKYKIKHLIFASTSSVYGSSKKFPLKETDNTDMPLSFYAATKKSNEIMAYSYSNIYKLSSTGLRFFTVYGPFGRPDMALFKFVDGIFKSIKIELFNGGFHQRDFTYIDDVITPIAKLINKPSNQKIPYQIFNIASDNPKSLKTYLSLIEKNIGKFAKVQNKGIQAGDVIKTHGSVTKLYKYISFKPRYSINEGIIKFISWYKNYYNQK